MTKAKAKVKKLTKKEIYAKHGIEFRNEDGKILAPLFGWINPLLINGNTKLGKGVWTYSTLPTNKVFELSIEGCDVKVYGTCPCHCEGCYATKGNYCFSSTKVSLARKTILQRLYLDFVKRALIAQIEADNIRLCRIHAAGDFDPKQPEYTTMWHEVVETCTSTLFWTYTKNPKAEHAFDDLGNINVVKSIIEGIGFNFGKCEYIIRVYHELRRLGKSVYICRCGIDDNQHCVNCKGCVEHTFVLFVEHSTGYVAKEDPLYPELVELIESQKSMTEELLVA